MSLEDTFYVLGIIVMSISLIILIVLTAAVIVIRNKVNHLHQAIEEKLNFVTSITDIAKKVRGK